MAGKRKAKPKFLCWHGVLLLPPPWPKRPNWRGVYECANCHARVKIRRERGA